MNARCLVNFGAAALAVVCTLLTGCEVAPMQAVPQPRAAVLEPPDPMPRIPPPDARAAQVPDGYTAEVVISGLTYPSSVEFDGQGGLFVAEAGYVYGDAAAPARILRFDETGAVEVLVDQLSAPVTDLLWYQERLYLSHKGKVSVLDEQGLHDIVTGLPSLGDHQNNQLVVGPDGKLYIGQGTATNSGVVGIDNFVFGWLKTHPDFHDRPANTVHLKDREFLSINPFMLTIQGKPMLATTAAFQPFNEADQDRISGETKANGTVLRFDPDGSNLEVFAWGLRNPFGLAWSPDNRLYVTENGYDARGSRPIANAPDCVWVARQGAWYGWPDFAGGVPVTDPQFKQEEADAPEFLMAAHPPVEQPVLRRPPHVGLTKAAFGNERFGFAGQLFMGEVGDMQPITGAGQQRAGFQIVRFDPATGEASPFFRARPDSLGQKHLEYVTTPGPKRLMDVVFSPDGEALYVVDLGALMAYPSAAPVARPFPGTGVVWRIRPEGSEPQFRPKDLAIVPATQAASQ